MKKNPAQTGQKEPPPPAAAQPQNLQPQEGQSNQQKKARKNKARQHRFAPQTVLFYVAGNTAFQLAVRCTIDPEQMFANSPGVLLCKPQKKKQLPYQVQFDSVQLFQQAATSFRAQKAAILLGETNANLLEVKLEQGVDYQRMIQLVSGYSLALSFTAQKSIFLCFETVQQMAIVEHKLAFFRNIILGRSIAASKQIPFVLVSKSDAFHPMPVDSVAQELVSSPKMQSMNVSRPPIE